jgi:hypothetical protein
MLRMLVCGLAVLALSSSSLLAKPGIVKTKDGNMTYEGDVIEKPDPANAGGILVEITGGKGGPVTLNKANVIIRYPDEVAAEVREGLKKIEKTDVVNRIKMANLANEYHAYEAARDALQEALLIEPGNKEAAELLASVNKHIPVPATLPTTNPVGPTTTAAKPTKPQLPFGVFLVKRLVNPREINHIKQLEWLSDDSKKMTVRIDPETRRRIQANFNLPGMDVKEFNALPQSDQALLILKNRDDLAGGVTIMTDPASVAEFKKGVRSIVARSCATAGCHGGTKAGTFTLSMGSDDAATYTNFLTLQMYSLRVRGIQRGLVDRTFPESSLLLDFMLDPSIAISPHPDVPNAKGTLRNKNAPTYQQVLHWVKSLDAKLPQYGIDLSEPATPPPPRK